MKKDLFTTSLLAWVMCLLLPARVMAQTEFNGIWYECDESSKTASVVQSQGTEYAGAIVIPQWIWDEEDVEKSYVVLNILDNAFSECSGLTSITIPESVGYIGNEAFQNCSNLTSINIPEGVMFIGDNTFQGCSSLTSITIPESVTSIGWWAFAGCSGLTSVTIPESVTSIGNYAFSRCSGLTSITIPASVTSIEYGAFEYCHGLTSITLPEGVTSIGWSAFEFCSGLTSITLPESVTSIGRSAFHECRRLTSITIPASVATIGYEAFFGCSGLTSITIPKSITSIGGGAFWNCSGLTSIVVASGNAVYDSRENCNAIINTSTNELIAGCKNTVIPASVTSIGEYAFYCCSGLTSITIPESVTSIGVGAFDRCSSLTSITISEGVTSIGGGAFSNCSVLTSITIPESVTSIGDYAFSDCSGLTSVTVKNPTPVTINSYTFENHANATLYVPAGSKAAYEVANYWKEFKAIVEMTSPEEPAYPEIESFAVVLDGERQTLHGKLVAKDGEEYIVTDAGVYRVTGRRERLAGDVNADGKITIADVTALVNVILGHAEAESATIYNVEHVEGVTGFPGNGDFIGWGGVDEDGSLDPNVKKQRF